MSNSIKVSGPVRYTKRVKFTSTNNYGSGPYNEDDVYTIAEFNALCQDGSFIDYDGFGNPVANVNPNGEPVYCCDVNWIVSPSRYTNVPDDATHIVWYNR